eukprot:3278685-Prymnesium_polylepis.1
MNVAYSIWGMLAERNAKKLYSASIASRRDHSCRPSRRRAGANHHDHGPILGRSLVPQSAQQRSLDRTRPSRASATRIRRERARGRADLALERRDGEAPRDDGDDHPEGGDEQDIDETVLRHAKGGANRAAG